MPDQPDAIRATLRNILQTDAADNSPRLAQLLTYLVEETLAGRQDRIKGYTIGIDVFGKNEDFDPATDSLVRVQMARLRSLLDEYYATDGRDDPVRIALEKGNYVPRFIEAETNADPGQALVVVPQPKTSPSDKPSDSRVRVLGLSALATMAVILVALAVLQWRALNDPVRLAAEQPDGPTVYVAPFTASGPAELAAPLASGLQHELIAYLSQLPNLGVVGYESSVFDGAEPSSLGADFVLRGSVSASGASFSVSTSLVRMRDAVTIWSSVSEPQVLDPPSFLEAQSQIALSVASELGQPYGVIPETMRSDLVNHRTSAMDHYLCELRAYEYMRAKSRERQAAVRTCLETAVEDNPNHAQAWALLAWIYGDDARQEYTSVDAVVAFERSLTAARNAVAANTTDPTSYTQLAIAQYFTGDNDAALQAIDTALRLAPHNSEILANASWLLSSIEDNPTAAELAIKAMELNPGHPAWYWLGPTYDAFQRGDAEESLRFARLHAADRSPLADYLLIAALHMNGRDEEALRVKRRQARDFPQASAKPLEMLEALRLPEAVVPLVSAGLAAAGS